MKLFSAAVLATAVSAGTTDQRHHRHTSVKTCTQFKRHTDGVFFGKKVDTCILSKVMSYGNLGRDQIRKAAAFIDHPTFDAEKTWTDIIENWKMLTGTRSVKGNNGEPIDCGFKNNVMVHPSRNSENWEGYINQCDLLCAGLGPNVRDVESAKNAIKTILNGLITIVNDQFAERYPDAFSCLYNELDVWVDPKKLFETTDGWVNGWGNKCRHEDRCGQLITNTYGNIAKFELILGEKFPNLSNGRNGQNYENQMKKLKSFNEETGLPDDLFLTGIFGVGKFIVESKRQYRIKDCEIQRPQNKEFCQSEP